MPQDAFPRRDTFARLAWLSHEGPLVAFTSLAIAGTGILAASLLASPPVRASAGPVVSTLDLVVALLTAGGGLALSTLHLGRRRRAALALRKAGRSPLSTEVLLGLLVCGLGAIAVAGRFTALRAPALEWALVLAAWSFLVSVGFVYRLPGQRAWGIESAFAPLAAGLLVGLAWKLSSGPGVAAGFGASLPWVVGIDTALLGARWWRIGSGSRDGALPAFPAAFRLRHALMAGRLLALDVLVLVFVAAGVPQAALGAAAAGVVIDRFSFYALALRVTVEGRIQQVEAVIAERR